MGDVLLIGRRDPFYICPLVMIARQENREQINDDKEDPAKRFIACNSLLLHLFLLRVAYDEMTSIIRVGNTVMLSNEARILHTSTHSTLYTHGKSNDSRITW